MKISTITIRLPESEKKKLKDYCEETGRQQTEVLRELIRALTLPGKD